METPANAATVNKRLHPGRKRLVFVDSRRGVEELGKLLREAEVDTHVIHGSLSASSRRDVDAELERLYGRRNFAKLYAVFSTPKLINVRWNERELGTLDAQFLAGNDDEPGRSTFTLAGRAWKVVHIDWRRAVCLVEPTDQARNTRWSGAPQYLGYELCQAMREILISDDEDSIWSKRAREVIATMRREHEFLQLARAPILVDGEEISWWTFAGGRANLLLAKLIESELGGTVVVRNESLTCRGSAGESIARLQEWLASLRATGRPNPADALRLASAAARSRISKFEPCLPESILDRLAAAMVVDVEGAVAVMDAERSRA